MPNYVQVTANVALVFSPAHNGSEYLVDYHYWYSFVHLSYRLTNDLRALLYGILCSVSVGTIGLFFDLSLISNMNTNMRMHEDDRTKYMRVRHANYVQ